MGGGTIRYSPTEFPGKLMVHCHRLIHEDLGMMATEQVGEQEGGTCTCTAASERGLGLGAIIGVAAGAVVLVAIAGYCVYRRKRRVRAAVEAAENNDLELIEIEK